MLYLYMEFSLYKHKSYMYACICMYMYFRCISLCLPGDVLEIKYFLITINAGYARFFFLRLAFGSGRNHVAAASANANKKNVYRGEKNERKNAKLQKVAKVSRKQTQNGETRFFFICLALNRIYRLRIHK